MPDRLAKSLQFIKKEGFTAVRTAWNGAKKCTTLYQFKYRLADAAK